MGGRGDGNWKRGVDENRRFRKKEFRAVMCEHYRRDEISKLFVYGKVCSLWTR